MTPPRMNWAPVAISAVAWNSTWTNLLTRPMARNMCVLPSAELGAVDGDIADLGVLERLAFGAGVLVFGQTGDAVTLEAAVQRAAGELGDLVLEAAHDVVPGGTPGVVERQERASPELGGDGLLGLGQHGAAGLGSHRGINGDGALAPFQDGFGVEAVLGGEGAGRRLRCLEFGANARRCSGAAVENCCHGASSS